jgi:hypothetical protein
MSDDNQVLVPIEWYVPDDLVARYATNMIVQKSKDEYFISFFEVKPPLILGEPKEIIGQVKQLSSVRATCVAQVIVSSGRMPDFVKALEKNLSTSFEIDDSDEESK